MATWLTHLRVAEKLLKTLENVDEAAFFVGVIAPDSGRMVDDFTYMPSKDTSHWKREGVSYEQRFEDNREFFTKYALDEKDNRMYSFYLGYYVHILTDTIYVRDIIHPFINGRGREIWRANIKLIRKSWYEIDCRFLEKNENYRPLEIIGGVKEFPNTTIDYFAYDDITERINYAYEFYKNVKTDPDTEFFTHDEKRSNEIVESATAEIRKILKEKHNI